MATFSKIILSGSTNGRAIKIAATATPGTIIHTTGASATDEIHLFASNTDPDAKKVTIEFGGTTAPDDLIEAIVPGEGGLFVLVPGLVLTNSLVVRAFAETLNVVMIHGYVNRIE